MLIDEKLVLFENFDLAGQTAVAKATNTIDFGETTVNPGVNKRAFGYLNIQVTADITGGTTPTITIVDSADNASFAQVKGTGAISLVGMKAGETVSVILPRIRQFLTVKYAAGSAATGKVSVWVGDKATQN